MKKAVAALAVMSGALGGCVHIGDAKVVIEPSEVVVGATPKAIVTNTSGGVLDFGLGFSVWAEKGGWHVVGDGCAVPAIGLFLRPGQSARPENVYACEGGRGEPMQLEVGQYRVTKEVSLDGDTFTIGANFEVVDR